MSNLQKNQAQAPLPVVEPVMDEPMQGGSPAMLTTFLLLVSDKIA